MAYEQTAIEIMTTTERLAFTPSSPLMVYDSTLKVMFYYNAGWLSMIPNSQVVVSDSAGYGSTATAIKRFTTIDVNTGTDITYATNSVDGNTFTINVDGVYSITYTDYYSLDATDFGISRNATGLLTSPIYALGDPSKYLGSVTTSAANFILTVSWTGHLVAGDIIRAHADSLANGVAAQCQFTIARLA